MISIRVMKSGKKLSGKGGVLCPLLNNLNIYLDKLSYLRSQSHPQREPAGHEIQSL